MSNKLITCIDEIDPIFKGVFFSLEGSDSLRRGDDSESDGWTDFYSGKSTGGGYGESTASTIVDAVSLYPLLFFHSKRHRYLSFNKAWKLATNEERKVLIQWLLIMQTQSE